MVVSATGAVLRWKVLGPVEAYAGGRQLYLQRPRQRAVLAYLLLNANRVVPTGQVIDALWGESPPSSARAQVQACVSHLRRALPYDTSDVLITQAGGYRIVVTDGELDHAEFAERVKRARAAAAGGKPADAADLLRSALALWRGVPLGGASGAFVVDAAAALQEQRLAAYEELVDIELALGRYTELIPELSLLVTENPLRERLSSQFVLALAGAGQPVQALQFYDTVKLRLADELGLEPGPHLAAAHLGVLRQEVPVSKLSLEAAANSSPRKPAQVVVAQVTPAQLPPAPVWFVGREQHLARLDQVLLKAEQGARTVVLSGTAGVGKSALALQWAHRSVDRFPDGQLYLDLRGRADGRELSPSSALGMLLRSLGVPAAHVPTSCQEAANLYRSMLAGRRVLVVLDDAVSVDQVRPLLPGCITSGVVITSRDHLVGLVARDGVQPVPVDLFSPAESRALLVRALGQGRVNGESEAVDRLAAACAHLPLALRIAAAKLAGQPQCPIANRVAELRGGDALSVLAVENDKESWLEGVFDLSYGSLSTAAQRLFRLLGHMPGDWFTVEAATALTDGTPMETIPLLNQLAAAHLIHERSPGLFTVHRLFRQYARRRLVECEGHGLRRLGAGGLRTGSRHGPVVPVGPGWTTAG
ncbi:BTAD domain-containing putative transcriptional regulator [Micromonospora sp. NPDC048830]|uniref:BTAD domain-containing putative transcriptional regulator n=1 Tax=Micromonospora sp. NPDC048830 TaxID=3364257 RepID=UPI00371E3EB8